MCLSVLSFKALYTYDIPATMIILLQSVALETMLKEDASSLTVTQFQYEVKKNHYQDLYGLLQKDYKSAMPVLDPTQGNCRDGFLTSKTL